MYKIYDTVMKTVEKFFILVIYLTSVFIPVALCVAVIFRYFLKSPLMGVDELCSLSFTAMVLAGSAVLFRQKRYIVIDAFVKGIKGKPRAFIDLLCELLILAVICGLLYCFWIAIPVQAMFTTAVYQIPKSVYSIALIIVFAYMFCACLEHLFLAGKKLAVGTENGEA